MDSKGVHLMTILKLTSSCRIILSYQYHLFEHQRQLLGNKPVLFKVNRCALLEKRISHFQNEEESNTKKIVNHINAHVFYENMKYNHITITQLYFGKVRLLACVNNS